MAEADGARPPAAREVRCRGCGELLGALTPDGFVTETMRLRRPFSWTCRRCGTNGRWEPRRDNPLGGASAPPA